MKDPTLRAALTHLEGAATRAAQALLPFTADPAAVVARDALVALVEAVEGAREALADQGELDDPYVGRVRAAGARVLAGQLLVALDSLAAVAARRGLHDEPALHEAVRVHERATKASHVWHPAPRLRLVQGGAR